MNRSERDVVLIVDDTPGSLSFLTDALEEAGLSVLVATDGAGALALTQKVTPDVVLMDAVMPGLDGFQTCAALKARGGFEHVPVIFMTGLAETEHVVMGLGAGGVDYVTKPIVPEELIARIRVHLANARMASGVRLALDATGRHLVAVTADGRVLWTTSQAAGLLEGLGGDGGDGVRRLPAACLDWLARTVAAPPTPTPGGRSDPVPPLALPGDAARPACTLGFVAPIGANEYLLRLTEGERQDDAARLHGSLAVTPREAEVLAWLARGKSNRDIATILGLSPRTVDKHLEQIYAKLGVENRAAAVGVALRALAAG